jgi:lysophospholipase
MMHFLLRMDDVIEQPKHVYSSKFQHAKFLRHILPSVQYNVPLNLLSYHHANLQVVLFGGLGKSQNSSIDQALSLSYAPITVNCPSDVQWVRPANGVGDAEAEWVSNRKIVVLDALEDYLNRLCLEDFDVSEFLSRMKESNYEHVPTLGMAISGGGYRSGYTGTGVMRALDSRLPAANEEKTGGLLQSLTYLTGV